MAEHMLTRTVARSPHVVDGSRSVHPNGRFPTAALALLGFLPLLLLLLAVVDDRAGFRLVMLSLALYTGMLTVALSLWVRSLRERLVRIATTGPLRFTPPVRVRVALWLVPAIGMLPALANLLVLTLDLPTMGGRLLEWGPYALGLVSLVGLGRELIALRRPLGLVVDDRGLRGVRGSASIEASWDQIGTVGVVGPHGPKLAISITGEMPAIVDARRIGSDPAAVAAVLMFFRDHPDHRQSLADGITAMQTVAGELQP